MIVLIVPLWNWNTQRADAQDVEESFNRTFMELKFKRLIISEFDEKQF